MKTKIKKFIANRKPEIYLEDLKIIRKFLNKQEQVLFYRMPIFDQRHSLDIAYLLYSKIKDYKEKNKNQELPFIKEAVAAALLHDVGKMEAKFSLKYRCLFVMLKKIFKKNKLWTLFLKLGESKRSPNLFRNLYVLEYHNFIGAYLLKQTKTDSKVIEMVEQHTEPINLSDPLVFNFLKEADELAIDTKKGE